MISSCCKIMMLTPPPTPRLHCRLLRVRDSPRDHHFNVESFSEQTRFLLEPNRFIHQLTSSLLPPLYLSRTTQGLPHIPPRVRSRSQSTKLKPASCSGIMRTKTPQLDIAPLPKIARSRKPRARLFQKPKPATELSDLQLHQRLRVIKPECSTGLIRAQYSLATIDWLAAVQHRRAVASQKAAEARTRTNRLLRQPRTRSSEWPSRHVCPVLVTNGTAWASSYQPGRCVTDRVLPPCLCCAPFVTYFPSSPVPQFPRHLFVIWSLIHRFPPFNLVSVG